ncbi:hypothetical protein AB0I28_29800 [Phytomonospora sp. NPDC050363]|uniref:hypothetical protein n=1 Tax=Phytomonospora sp. NPDC050363 TaxID=3155642 RepID=UPI0033FF63C8
MATKQEENGGSARIVDVDFTPAPADELNSVSVIPWSDVKEAADLIVQAAITARVAEIHQADVLNEGPTVGDAQRYREMVNDADFDWIGEKFQYFYERWPAFAGGIASSLQEAKQSLLSGRMTPINNVADVTDAWAGEAQHDFKSYFLNPMLTQAVSNQQLMFDELTVAMQAYESILRQCRHDAVAIARETIKVLDSITDKTPEDVQVTLGVLGVAVGVVATVASGGTATGLTLGLIGSGISAVSTGVSAAQNINGDTVESVMSQLRTTLDDLKEAMDNEEQAIADGLAETETKLQGWLSSSDPLTVGTILANEPNDDGTTDISDGHVPPESEFGPKR